MNGTTIEADGIQEHMRKERWGEAAQLLSCQPKRDPAAELQLTISRNLAALQRCRPHVYHTLLSCRDPNRYTLGTSASGHPTIFYRTDSGSSLSLSPGNQPVTALAATFAGIKQQYQAGHAMAVVGIGDGYFIKSCSLNPPKLGFDAQQPVYLFEPDAQAVMAALTIHDYTGAFGPIENPRFHWFIGRDYGMAAREALIGDLYNPPPVFQVAQSPHAEAIGTTIKQLLDEILTTYKQLQEKVNGYYRSVTREQLRAIYSANPPRPARVLLITTRRSSVLRYSTQDAADGFRAIGWEALVFIEPAPHQVVTRTKLLDLVDAFKPDLIFQIDHLRREWGEMFPPQLPFACWVQDHLSNLTTREAGATLGPRDYLLAAMPAMYVERYGYPRAQFIDLSKLTRIPVRPSRWKSDGDDLVYVSTASQKPAEIRDELTQRFSHSPEIKRLIAAACERIIAVYDEGETLSTPQSIRFVFEQVESALGLRIDHPPMRQEVLDALFDRLGNVLYRQQSLGWAARAAEKFGLKLSIYGAGWESHPNFHRFARGKISYGADLENLTRRSKINLVLEPFLNVSHQRLLDGLVAGGFFLIRHHPSNLLFQELLNFLTENVSEEITAVEGARSALDGELRVSFDDLIRRCECLTGAGDLVDLVRGAARSGMLLPRAESLPHLPEVSFNSPAELEQRIVAFQTDESRRGRISNAQRLDIEQRLSYSAGMKHVAEGIHHRLKHESP